MSSCCCFDIVSTSEVGVIENCGKFSRLGEAGCICLFCPMEYIAGRVSLRVQELPVRLETKTLDNVFVTVDVSVQYQVIREKVYSAFYILSTRDSQMKAYVYDSIRASLCGMTLDHAFESKDQISFELKSHLQEVMSTYGLLILNALVTDLTPDSRVRDAMNEINASQRLREAAAEKAEAEKILQVKAAEAEADSKYLSGLGVARQRRAIVDGLLDTVNGFSGDVPGASAKDVMDLLLVTQYFDMIRDIGGKKSQNSTLFLPHGPQAIEHLRTDLRGSFRMGVPMTK
mmetsp:Transcript_17419/g.12443  ORF Transcript_17419/g.12443 Transcript_17419/m.12443 type:complete len:287 (+) Transcript_17419:51-911(+)